MCVLWFSIIQEPSVALAIQLLDGTSFRPGGKTLMSVSPAKFEQKGKQSICQKQISYAEDGTDAVNLLQVMFSFLRRQISKRKGKPRKLRIKF